MVSIVPAIVIYAGIWWLYGVLGTYFLGTQAGGRPLVWLATGLLLGPAGMLAAIVIPAFRGLTPQTMRRRWTASGFTFGLLVISEVLVRSDGGRSALLSAFFRYNL